MQFIGVKNPNSCSSVVRWYRFCYIFEEKLRLGSFMIAQDNNIGHDKRPAP